MLFTVISRSYCTVPVLRGGNRNTVEELLYSYSGSTVPPTVSSYCAVVATVRIVVLAVAVVRGALNTILVRVLNTFLVVLILLVNVIVPSISNT